MGFDRVIPTRGAAAPARLETRHAVPTCRAGSCRAGPRLPVTWGLTASIPKEAPQRLHALNGALSPGMPGWELPRSPTVARPRLVECTLAHRLYRGRHVRLPYSSACLCVSYPWWWKSCLVPFWVPPVLQRCAPPSAVGLLLFLWGSGVSSGLRRFVCLRRAPGGPDGASPPPRRL